MKMRKNAKPLEESHLKARRTMEPMRVSGARYQAASLLSYTRKG